MNDYTKGILTGASLILCFFMLVSAKSQDKNLGDITVDSITVLNEEGKRSIILTTLRGEGHLMTRNADGNLTATIGSLDGLGFIGTYGVDGNLTVRLGSNQKNVGALQLSNADGTKSVVLGGSKGGGGHLETYSKHEVLTGYFGTNTENDGMAALNDRYGDEGWSACGKK